MTACRPAPRLRYQADTVPGIRRRRAGNGFTYLDPAGNRIEERASLERIRRLAIPPAWEDVWIAPDPQAHLQATGRDRAGRKQYRYHELWSSHRNETKFDTLPAFARRLPHLRRQLARDLKREPLDRRFMLAAAVRLLQATRIRVGNREYTRRSGARGLTTLSRDDLAIEGACIELHFTAKGGKDQHVRACDASLSRLMRTCQELPGQTLFAYPGADGELVTIDSGAVNRYLQEHTGGPFTAKDFRTWTGTVEALAVLAPMAGGRRSRRELNAALGEVADRLGNTRAVCRKYYIHPVVIELFESGALAAALERARSAAVPNGLSRQEGLALALLENEAACIEPARLAGR